LNNKNFRGITMVIVKGGTLQGEIGLVEKKCLEHYGAGNLRND
jgi:hypothetical protein